LFKELKLQNFTQMQPALQDGDEPAMVSGMARSNDVF
jgi:hypothetical protein